MHEPLFVLLSQAPQMLQVAWAKVALSDREFESTLLAYTSNIKCNSLMSAENAMLTIRALIISPEIEIAFQISSGRDPRSTTLQSPYAKSWTKYSDSPKVTVQGSSI